MLSNPARIRRVVGEYMVERYAPGELLDPRGELHRWEVALAPGVSIEDLRRGPVLFYLGLRYTPIRIAVEEIVASLQR